MAWAHFSSLAIASFMYHATRFDVYWRLDRTLCYVFILPFLLIEILQKVKQLQAKVFLLGVYAMFVSIFATRDDLFDVAGDAVSYSLVGLYGLFVIVFHRKDTLRMIYIGLGTAILVVAYLLLREFEFCHGHPWLGNLAIGHIVTVPGSTLLLASSFLPEKAERGAPVVTNKTIRANAYQLIF